MFRWLSYSLLSVLFLCTSCAPLPLDRAKPYAFVIFDPSAADLPGASFQNSRLAYNGVQTKAKASPAPRGQAREGRRAPRRHWRKGSRRNGRSKPAQGYLEV